VNAPVLGEIQAEVERAMRKFPRWPTDPIHAAAVIAEECGELQKAVLEAVYEPYKGSRPNIRTEAVQTAAMCLRFIASLDDYEWFHAKQHPQNAHALAEERSDDSQQRVVGHPNGGDR
jgi:NTP pyrophosphatase (non-canonical NTP hydrolase)